LRGGFDFSLLTGAALVLAPFFITVSAAVLGLLGGVRLLSMNAAGLGLAGVSP
jgi:hypothetical protein